MSDSFLPMIGNDLIERLCRAFAKGAPDEKAHPVAKRTRQSD